MKDTFINPPTRRVTKTNTTNHLPAIVTTLTVILGLALAATSATAADVRPDTITVRGTATTNVTADTVFITLYATAEGMVADQAVTKAAERADAIKAALLKAWPQLVTVTATDVKLGEKSSRIYRPDDSESTPHPEAVKRLIVTLKFGAADLAKVLDTALLAGATLQVNSPNYAGDLGSAIQYGLVSSATIESAMTDVALADAQRRAAALAKAAGRSVGSITCLAEEQVPNLGMVYSRASQLRLPAHYLSTSPDDVEISRSVQVTYLLK